MIAKDKVVSLTYDLHSSENNDEKVFVESAKVEKPFTFLFGTGSLIPQFEGNLAGKKTGDKFEFDIDAANAYGMIDKQAIVEIPVKAFEVDGEVDKKMMEPGTVLPMSDQEGNRMVGRVLSSDDDNVQMDFNHPLAGKNLHFKGEVLSIRDASAEEIDHGHVHDGTHHH